MLMGFLVGEIKFKLCSRNASNAFQKEKSTQPARPDESYSEIKYKDTIPLILKVFKKEFYSSI